MFSKPLEATNPQTLEWDSEYGYQVHSLLMNAFKCKLINLYFFNMFITVDHIACLSSAAHLALLGIFLI